MSDVARELHTELVSERCRRQQLQDELDELKSKKKDGPFRTVVELRGQLREDDGKLVQTYREFVIGKEFWLKRGERKRETIRIHSPIFRPVLVVVQGPGLIACAAVAGNIWARSDSWPSSVCSGGVLSCELGHAPLDPAWGIDVEVVSSMPPEDA